MAPGIVLMTSGGSGYKCIYHAGFHRPSDWLVANDDEDAVVTHVNAIGSCIRKVFERLDNDNVKSVAFPLIGCGVFDIDPSLLAYQFMEELLAFADQQEGSPSTEIFLVVRNLDDSSIKAVSNSLVQAILDAKFSRRMLEPLGLGVSYLDMFEEKHLGASHAEWLAWMAARYCELLTGLAFYHLACMGKNPLAPWDLVKEDRPASFGLTRDKATRLASGFPGSNATGGWQSFFAWIFNREAKNRVLLRVIQDRNNIAHGRNFRPVSEIWQDVKEFACISSWEKNVDRIGPPSLDLVSPWVVQVDNDGKIPAIFDRWRNKSAMYIEPISGKPYKLPIKA